LLFRLHEGRGELEQAAAVVERWRQVHGQDEPGLRFLLQQLRDEQRRDGQRRP
jgi:hypothetical protein